MLIVLNTPTKIHFSHIIQAALEAGNNFTECSNMKRYIFFKKKTSKTTKIPKKNENSHKKQKKKSTNKHFFPSWTIKFERSASARLKKWHSKQSSNFKIRFVQRILPIFDILFFFTVQSVRRCAQISLWFFVSSEPWYKRLAIQLSDLGYLTLAM